jgi:DNA-binding HxlR family transcriptional regulator
MVTLRKPTDDAHDAQMQGFSVYSSECPARAVLDHVGDKWALLILRRLAEGPRRFNALRRDIAGISQKVLSQVLKRLERDGLLTRTVTPSVPVSVEYALTVMGETLTERVCPVLRWAEENMPAILRAQDLYDAKQAAA